MTKTLIIEDICFYRNYEGDVRGVVDLVRDGWPCSFSFCIYSSKKWEYKGWQNCKSLNKEQKKEIETEILKKVA